MKCGSWTLFYNFTKSSFIHKVKMALHPDDRGHFVELAVERYFFFK